MSNENRSPVTCISVRVAGGEGGEGRGGGGRAAAAFPVVEMFENFRAKRW